MRVQHAGIRGAKAFVHTLHISCRLISSMCTNRATSKAVPVLSQTLGCCIFINKSLRVWTQPIGQTQNQDFNSLIDDVSESRGALGGAQSSTKAKHPQNVWMKNSDTAALSALSAGHRAPFDPAANENISCCETETLKILTISIENNGSKQLILHDQNHGWIIY